MASIKETIRELAIQLRSAPLRDFLGEHAVVLPREITRTFLSYRCAKGWRCRLINERELAMVIDQAFQLNLKNWRPASRYPDQLTFPWSRYGLNPSDFVAKYVLLIEDGWELCPICHEIKEEFSEVRTVNRRRVQVEAPLACADCLSSFQFQTKETVRCWIFEWYKRRGHEIRDGILFRQYSPIGNGEHKLQLDTFELVLGGNYIRSLFRNRCAYCGVPLDCPSETGKRLHYDHVVARKWGAHNVAENIVISCHSCNASKGAKSATDFYAFRRSKGLFVPHEFELIVRDIEQRYLECYSQFTAFDIVQIKRPVEEALAALESRE